MSDRMRYVEVSYDLPDNPSRFSAIVTRAATPDMALAEAEADVRRRHPRATDVREFMQRPLTDKRAGEITSAIEGGTWQGWDTED
jgi:hypothetical protein